MSKNTLKIHSENILPIIKQWLYSDKDIFLRELISNSCDAISKLKILADEGKAKLEGDENFRIDVAIDKEAKTITIRDNGIGMTGKEVDKYISQLAFSGAEEFVKKYKSAEEKDQIIGHFGLGFYSSFMVSTQVEIDTKSYQARTKAAHWTCDGSCEYELLDSERKERGTEITLHIGEDSVEYLDEAKVTEIIKQYCSFLPYPIYVGEDHINQKEPLWLKNPSECTDEEYKEFYRALYPMEPEPIFWIHLNVDYPFHLKGILYFPKITQRFDFQKSHTQLYCNRVFVSDDVKDILPEHLAVLRGAIDSPDIPLNVSRSYLQMDRTVRQLGAHISKKVSDRLVSLFNSDREAFQNAWEDIETIVKIGCLHDEKFYERVKDILIWKNADDTWTTLTDYIEAHKEAYSGKVYYTMAEKSHSDFLNLYKEKKIEVLTIGGPLDSTLFNHLENKNEGVKFQRIDGGIDDLILDSEKEQAILDADGKSESGKIAEFVKNTLDVKELEVEAKSLASDTVPGFVVIDEQTRRMRDYFAMTQKDMPLDAFGKRTFVVNTNNRLIKSAYGLQSKDPELAKALTQHLFDISLLGQKELHADQVSNFITRANDVLAKLAEKSID